MTDIAMRILISAQSTADRVIASVGGQLAKLAGDAGPLLLGFGAVAVAAGVVGAAAVKMAADYQQSMLKVQALTGMTSAQAQQMSDQILQMAPQLGKSPKDLADSLYFVASAGFKGADALNIMRLAAEAGATGNFDSKIAADALTSALNAFGLKGKDAGNIMDELTSTVTAGKMEWADYARVAGKLASTSAQNKVSFVEANAALAQFTNSGVTARQASTQLNNTFIQLEQKTDSIAKHAKALGIAFNENKFKSMDLAHQVQYLDQITHGHNSTLLKLMNNNSTAARTIEFLRDHYQAWGQTIQDISSKMRNGQTTQDKFNIAQQGFNQTVNRAKAALDVLLIRLGEQLLPLLTQLVGAVAPAVTGLMNFADAVSKNEVAMALIKGALVGFTIVVLAAVIPALWAWAGAAAGAAIAQLALIWPLLLLGAVIALVVAGVILAIKHWGAITQWFSNLWKTVWGAISSFFVGIWNHIVSFVSAAVAAVVNFIKSHWQLLVSIIGGPLVAIVLLVITHWNQIKAAFSAAFLFVVGLVKRGWDAITGVFRNAWSLISSALGILWNDLKNWFVNLAGQAVSWGANIIKQLASGIIGAIAGAIGGAMSALGGFISSHLPHSPAKMGPLRNLPKQSAMISQQIAEGLIAGMPRIQNAMNLMLAPVHTTVAGQHVPVGIAPRAGGGTVVQNIGPIIVNGVNTNNPNQAADQILQALSRKLRQSGGLVTWTSGGKA